MSQQVPIVLSDSEPEPEQEDPQKAIPSAAFSRKRKATSEPSSTAREPRLPLSAAAAGSASTSTVDEDEEDVVFQGRTGQLALSDFPHCRAHCLEHAFSADDADVCYAACANCYCYVCDLPVAACQAAGEWEQHCTARHGVARWDMMRAAKAQAAKQQQQQAQQAQQASAATAAASASRAMLLSADELLTALEAVYPIETPEPRGLKEGIVLRPYQRQSLAFAVALETSNDQALVGRRGSVRGGMIVDEMGMGKTAVITSLILERPLDAYSSPAASSSPASSSSAAAKGGAKQGAKGEGGAKGQGGAKGEAVKAEGSSRGSALGVDGLPSSSSSSSLPTPLVRQFGGTKLKTTLVIVPNTLVGQWHDEVCLQHTHALSALTLQTIAPTTLTRLSSISIPVSVAIYYVSLGEALRPGAGDAGTLRG